MSISKVTYTHPTGWIQSGNQQVSVSCYVSGDSGDSTEVRFQYKKNSGSYTTLGYSSIVGSGNLSIGPKTISNLDPSDVITLRLVWRYYDNFFQKYYPSGPGSGIEYVDGAYYYVDNRIATFTVTPLPTAPTTNTTPSGYHSTTPTVTWSGATYAQTYDISYRTDGGTPSDTPSQTGLPSASYTFGTVPKGAVIKWKVRSVNLNGTSAWSSVYTTYVALDPVAPTIDETGSYVDNGEINVSIAPTIAWNENGSGASAATSYDVYFDSIDATTKIASGRTSLTYSLTNLGYGITYKWRILAKNAVGEAFSQVYTFTTETIPIGTPAAKSYKRRLCAVAGNRFYYENDDSPNSKMVLLKGLILDTTKEVQMFEAFRKVFIVNDDKKYVVDFSNIKLTLTEKPTTAPKRGDTISGMTSQAAMIIDYWDGDKVFYGYKTTSSNFQTNESLLLNGSTWDSNNNKPSSQLDPTVPHFYEWREYGGTKQNIPPYATIATLYRGRASLAGNSAEPNVFYLARSGNPHDFLYSADDYQSPIAANGTKYGTIGDTVTALAAYMDDYLFVGCNQSLWIVRGDPAAGGVIDLISKVANCFGPNSLCLDDSGNLWIVGTNAIYLVGNGGRSFENKTHDRIPTLIEDLNLSPDVHKVTVGIEKQSGGILFSITRLATGENTCFWYDPRVDGFFPDTYPIACGIYAQFYYEGDKPEYRKLIFGCRDGCLRSYENSRKSDQAGTVLNEEDTAIEGYVLIGPKQITQDRDRHYILNQIVFVLGGGGIGGTEADTDAIEFEVYGAETAEEVIESCNSGNCFESGQVEGPGRSIRHRLRMRAVFAGIKVYNNQKNQTWAMEEISAESVPAGSVL